MNQKLFFLFTFLWLISSWPSTGWGRVFSFDKENLAAYVQGSVGWSSVGQDAFANAGGTSTVFDHTEVQYNFSGEIGFQLGLDPLKLRLGAEILRPKDLEIKGRNSSGTELYTLESQIFVFNPSLTIEYIYSATKTTQFYGFIGAGYAMVSIDNEFTMTSTGTSTYPGVSDHSDKMKASLVSAKAGFGFETQFVDNVTFSMDFGYRYLPVKELKYSVSTVTLAEGSVQAGDVVHNSGNAIRTVDLSGVYLGAGFQFYINF